MRVISTAGSCSLVLDTKARSNERGRATERRPSSPDRDDELTGHFVLNRYRVDDDGHVSLTPPLPMSQLRGAIDILTTELESLLEQAKLRFPETKPAP
jgi:hypothetical protein